MLAMFVALAGCSKDSDEQQYTSEQQQVFDVFNGEWYDTQFSTVVNDKHVNCAIIAFGDHQDKPMDIYDNNGEYKYTKHGECRFYLPFDGESEKYIQCGYYVSPNGKTLDLRNESDNSLYHYYEISIKSETEMYLHQNGLSLPYIFVKSEKITK